MSAPFPLTVTARRSKKGARQRVLAVAEDAAAPLAMSWSPTGLVTLYGRNADGMFCVTIPAEAVERIRRGRPETAPVQP